MQLYFDPAFDAGAWPGALQGREAVVGEAWVGPLGLLQLLETRLGLSGPRVAGARRAAALVPLLGKLEGFWSRSAALDPLGTAFELLRWRDRLWQCGWRGQALSPRLAQLAQLCAAVLPGLPDRLALVCATLERRSAELAALTVFGSEAATPAVWRKVCAALAGSGARAASAGSLAASTLSRLDLGDARADRRAAPAHRP